MTAPQQGPGADSKGAAMVSRSFTITFPFLPPAVLRGNGRPAHWAQRHKAARDMREATEWRLREFGEWTHGIFMKATVQYEMRFCGKAIDPDNLIKSMKSCLDQIVEHGFLPDDGPDYVTILPVVYVRVPHREDVGVTVTVVEQL